LNVAGAWRKVLLAPTAMPTSEPESVQPRKKSLRLMRNTPALVKRLKRHCLALGCALIWFLALCL
jgi:hypothetical protein